MKKARRNSCNGSGPVHLPPDVVQRIATFIMDASEFFTFLDAFQGTSISLGTLQHLWMASFHSPFHMLWPELHVDEVSAARVARLETDRTYFKTIHVHAVYDLEILHSCVSATTSLSLYTCPLASEVDVPLETWYQRLAGLPISHLTWLKGPFRGVPQCMDPLVAVLPQMSLLTTIDLSNACVSSLEGLFDYIRDSKLTRLSLCNVTTIRNGTAPVYMASLLHRAELASLAHWLATQPVTAFAMSKWSVPNNQKVLFQFYDALWTCPTLHKFAATTQLLPHLDAYSFTTPLQIVHLSLTNCGLTANTASNLANAIAGSKVEWLDLSNNNIGFVGMHSLSVLGLRRSNVRQLFVDNCDLLDAGCSHLANVLPNTSLELVSLEKNQITDMSVMFLGFVLRTFTTLSSLHLRSNEVTITGAHALIESLGMRPCDVTHVVDLDDNLIDDVDQDTLETLAAKQPALKDCAFSCAASFASQDFDENDE
ncbi:hypothetical protein LEN26_005590 [Aphanomyces euteiches]|nr:hypothetical protein AeMF1_000571 [Aphanomyces euteiches]KAH9137739.1 hypothetical protein LEN26_005590 [Aphanomyces euteiches]KAH9194755.1 hypothetical protein AeNC1_003272 [Aphanomyces euteiches]